MEKLLIADSSRCFADSVAQLLRGMFEIRICCDGAEAADLLRSFRPDCLLIDLTIPGTDSLTLLENALSTGRKLTVLPITRYYSEYITHTLEAMGIPYLMTHPCPPHAVVARLTHLHHHVQDPQAPDDRINGMLLFLGIRTDLSGYACLRTALELLKTDSYQYMTKDLYPQIAKLCGGSAQSVERVMRSAIADAWQRRDPKIWQDYFPADRHGRYLCPANRVFLRQLSACLQHFPAKGA